MHPVLENSTDDFNLKQANHLEILDEEKTRLRHMTSLFKVNTTGHKMLSDCISEHLILGGMLPLASLSLHTVECTLHTVQVYAYKLYD